jgi:aquaporin Z
MTTSMRSAFHKHWPEYLIEAWALGCFMISAGLFVTVLESPRSALYALLPSALVRTVLLGLAMGLTAILLIHSPWGKRSGAHMNPAITLAFLRLRKIHPWDAAFFIIAQAIGGTLGVLIVAMAVGRAFTGPPICYAVTLPGRGGVAVALTAEAVISFILMATVLAFSGTERLARFTGLAVGFLVALFVTVELPLSGTSMNPARTLASAVPGMMWQDFWIYLVGPTVGMLAAAQLHFQIRGPRSSGCAKLLHPHDIRCIHCGHLSASQLAIDASALQRTGTARRN